MRNIHLALAALVVLVGCGDSAGTGGSGASSSGGAHTGGTNAGGTNAGGSNAGGTNAGGTNFGGGYPGGSNEGGSSAGGANEGGGTIVYCTENPNDPTACGDEQACVCGGPGAAMVCECGDMCVTDDDCTNPAQPTCCGGGVGQTGSCTSTCTCFCD